MASDHTTNNHHINKALARLRQSTSAPKPHDRRWPATCSTAPCATSPHCSWHPNHPECGQHAHDSLSLPATPTHCNGLALIDLSSTTSCNQPDQRQCQQWVHQQWFSKGNGWPPRTTRHRFHQGFHLKINSHTKAIKAIMIEHSQCTTHQPPAAGVPKHQTPLSSHNSRSVQPHTRRHSLPRPLSTNISTHTLTSRSTQQPTEMRAHQHQRTPAAPAASWLN